MPLQYCYKRVGLHTSVEGLMEAESGMMNLPLWPLPTANFGHALKVSLRLEVLHPK